MMRSRSLFVRYLALLLGLSIGQEASAETPAETGESSSTKAEAADSSPENAGANPAAMTSADSGSVDDSTKAKPAGARATKPSGDLAQAAPPSATPAASADAPKAAAASPPEAATPSPTPTAEAKPKGPTAVVSGYLNVQLSDNINANDDNVDIPITTFIRRARLRVKGDIVPKVGYTVMIDASTPNNLLRDGFISLGFIRNVEVRVGQQKTQFGYENPESATRLYVVNRALVSDLLGRGVDLRDLGIGALGSFKLGEKLNLEAAGTLVNGGAPNTVRDDNDHKNFWGRAGAKYTDDDSKFMLRAGLSIGDGDRLDRGSLAGPEDDVTIDFSRLGFDVEAETRWFFAAFEYVQGSNDRPDSSIDASGAYVLVAGKTRWNLGPIFRWETLSPNEDNGDLDLGKITLGAYYDYKPINARLMLQYEIDDSEVGLDDTLILFGQVVF